MMRPPIGFCAFMILMASWVHRNGPVRLAATTLEPGLVRQILQRHGRRAAAGIVEHQVEAAEGLLGPGEQGLDRFPLGDVGRHGQRIGGVVAGHARGLFERFLAAAGQHHLVAVLEQRQRRGAADAAA